MIGGKTMYTFEEIIGNEQIIKQIQYAIQKKQISHAYIIHGTEGSGKTLLANTMSKTLQCEKQGITPCNECISCHTFDSRNHTDIFYISPQKDKNSISVEDIRQQLIKNMEIKQYHYAFKIFIIEKADTMTVQAQNALLKTLEEPPHYGIIFLLANNIDKFLSTILSRCFVIKLRPIPSNDIEQYIIQHNLAQKENANMIAEYAQGSIGKAIEMANSETFYNMREDIISKLLSIKNKNLSEVLTMAKELEIYKQNQQFLDFIYLWYRDLLVYIKCNDIKYIIQKDQQKNIIAQCKDEKEDDIIQKIQAVWQAKQQLYSNSNFQLTMEVMLMKLKES